MGFVEWLKFYFLGFFSEKQAKKYDKAGVLYIIISADLAFLLFFVGFYAADVVPFSTHYENAAKYRLFAENTFGNGETPLKINAETAVYPKKINTYTSEGDREKYFSDGYNLIVDTRPSDTLIRFTQYAEKGEEEIGYEAYLALSEEAKEQYSLKIRYFDEELVLSDGDAARHTAFLEQASAEGSEKYNKSAAADYEKLKGDRQNMSDKEYAEELYYLFVKYYYAGAGSLLQGAKAPVLCDYYYINYLIGGKTDYLYVFDTLCTGSFTSDRGVPVTFGGYFDGQPDGEIADINAFIKQIFYASAGEAAASYFFSVIMQIPYLLFIPIILALLLWLSGKALKGGNNKSFTNYYKLSNCFVLFSAVFTAVITFVCGFLFSARAVAKFMPLIFGIILTVRTCISFALGAAALKRSADKETDGADGNV
ncbi:MAG: hypothetical protein NC489_41855 [Ruminococcus flavefaciens]|nr:hypothetical protein [Ruminococcus flavefaciens]